MYSQGIRVVKPQVHDTEPRPRRANRVENNSNNNARQNIRNTNYNQTFTGRGRRAQYYKKVQDLYHKNRAMLSDAIINGRSIETAQETPTVEHTYNYYSKLMGQKSHPEDTTAINNIETINISSPITTEEVDSAKQGWTNSASGPDRITIPKVKATDSDWLACILTLIVLSKKCPQLIKLTRTPLIYKTGDRKDPANYRPITVSSAILRLLHRILAKRIKANIRNNITQRGFNSIDVTMANCLILDCFIQTKKAENKNMAVVSMDIKKAFDTISHSSIEKALRKHGIDENTVEYIMNNLHEAKTTIKVGQDYTPEITTSRGVRQGDPLSPVLFNMVINELLTQFSRSGIKAMAFADDLILLADDPLLMQPIIDHTVEFMETKGMEVNPTKCTAICNTKKDGRIITSNRPIYRIKSEPIQSVTEINSFKYLGHQFSSTGPRKPSLATLPI